MTQAQDIKFALAGTECGVGYATLKYTALVDGLVLSKELTTHKGKRSAIYYWEDDKPVWDTLEECLQNRPPESKGRKARA